MVAILGIAEQEVKNAVERLEKTSTAEHAAAVEALSPYLFKSIKEGTLTVAEIDAFLNQSPQVEPNLREYLLSKKARLLLLQGLNDEALQHYDDALLTKETPTTWALKGAALLEMNRLDEAFHAFWQAYLLRGDFGSHREESLRLLFQTWSISAQLRGLFGILNDDSRELQKGIEEYLQVLENSRKEGITGTIGTMETGGPVSEELKDALNELKLDIRLLSIKDPFDRARALAKEVTKVWPEGVSAVDAVREQRDHGWSG